MTHAHHWDAMDIPGFCICICGATRYYKKETDTYYINEED